MEARIVHLPTTDVRVEADRIVIERLIVRDPALAAIVAGRDVADRPAFVERALKIGRTALQDATVSVDVDLVRDEFDKLLRSSELANAKRSTLNSSMVRSRSSGTGWVESQPTPAKWAVRLVALT